MRISSWEQLALEVQSLALSESVPAQLYTSTHSHWEKQRHTESLREHFDSQSTAIGSSKDYEGLSLFPSNRAQLREVQPMFLWWLPSKEAGLQEDLYRQREEVREPEHVLLLLFDRS